MFAFRLPVTLEINTKMIEKQNQAAQRLNNTQLSNGVANLEISKGEKKKPKHFELNVDENTKAVPSGKLRGSNV